MTISKKMIIFSYLYLIGLFAIDYFTKTWTVANINLMSWIFPTYPYGGVGIFESILGIDFSLNYVQNKGSAWGLFSEYSNVLFGVRVALVLGLMLYQLFWLKVPKYAFPITMVISGALCNLFDMAAYGFVIDMFHFNLFGYHFPVFNVADMSICIGVGLLFLYSFQEKRANAF